MSDAPTQASAPTPSANQTGGEVTRGTPMAPGGRARSESRARSTAEFSRDALLAIRDEVRGGGKQTAGGKQRDQSGRFAKSQDDAGKVLSLEPSADESAAKEPEAEQESTEAEAAETEATEAEKDDKAEESAAIAKEVEELRSKVDQAIARESRLREGATKAVERIQDLTDVAEHYKGLFEQARALIRNISGGRDIDPMDLRAAELELEVKRAKRGSVQMQQMQQTSQLDRQSKAIVSRAQAVIAKNPELDPKKNPAAKDFWRAYLSTADLKDIESDAEHWALVFRGRQIAEHKKREAALKPQTPKPQVRPEQSVASGGVERVGKVASIKDRLSDDYIKEEQRRWRMAQGGRR